MSDQWLLMVGDGKNILVPVFVGTQDECVERGRSWAAVFSNVTEILSEGDGWDTTWGVKGDKKYIAQAQPLSWLSGNKFKEAVEWRDMWISMDKRGNLF